MQNHNRGTWNMKKKMKIIILIFVVAVLAFLYAHIDKNTYLYDRDTPSETYAGTGILKGGEELEQTFVSQEELLDGINIKCTIVGNVDQVVLEYTIRDKQTGKTSGGTVDGAEIKNNKFNSFKIPEISDAKGREYTIELKETGSDEGNGITFYVDSSRQFQDSLTIRGEKTQGALVARTLTHRFDLETFIVLLGFIAFVVGFIRVLYKLFK